MEKLDQRRDTKISREWLTGELAELKALTAGFLGTVPGAFIVLDRQWRLVYLNGPAKKLFEGDEASFLGVPLENWYPKKLAHILSPKTIRECLEEKDKTLKKYSNYLYKWFKISAYTSDFGIFIRLEDITPEMLVNRLLRLNEFSVDSARDMVFWVKPGGHIIYANKSMCESLGYAKNDITRMKVSDVDPACSADTWAGFVDELKSLRSMTYESCLRARDGSLIPVEVTCSYLVYSRYEYLMAFARNITERKRADETLRLSEANLARSQTIAHLGSWELDVETGVMGGSDELYRIFDLERGASMEAAFGKMHPEDRARVAESIQAAIQGIKPYNIEYRIAPRPGEVRYVHAEGEVIRNEDGLPVKFFGIVHDITERKRADDALQESKERFRATFEQSAVGMTQVSLDGHFLRVNKKFCDNTGYTEGELLGMTVMDITYLPDVAAEKAKIKMLLAGEADTFSSEKRYVKKDGALIWVKLTASVVYDQGKPGYMVGVTEDITERKRAEEALGEARAQAELYLDLMGHDINNLNQVGMGYLEVAFEKLKEEGSLGKEDAELLEKPLHAIEDSTRLIDNVRKLRSAKSRDHKLRSIDLRKVLDGVKERFSKTRGRTVTINYRPAESRVLATELVKDVFVNIVCNAVKHSDATKPLVINIGQTHIREAGRCYVKVVVDDNGPGIPDELKARIFNRLERGNTKTKGRGLGLYLVKTLVQDFNGKIWVEDRVRGDHTKGARFVIIIPAIE